AGLWFFSTVFAYIAVQCVYVLDRAWQFLRRQAIRRKPAASVVTSSDGPGLPADPGRRYFFKAATAAAGATPFLGAVYGFASERLNYQIHRVELPISNLPTALDG